MSFLENASQPVIHGGQFTNVLSGDAHFYIGAPKASSNRGFDLLYQNLAAGAFYDAAERGDPPKCHPHTRLAILAEIQKWVQDPDIRQGFIIWLYGPAGAGKSAIAQTLAEIFARESLLVASFFFSRTGIGCNDTSRFVASIAYQLSLSIPEVGAHIAAAVEHDPFIFSRSLLSQMHSLVIKPLNAATAESMQMQPGVIIIDGLDEAREETTQKELLESLGAAIQQLHIPLIFLVASRPETVIRQAFNRQPLQSLMQGLALDADYRPADDIRTYLLAKFDEIKELHPSGNVLPVSWPSQDDVEYLVYKASGQFVYASTVMKYIGSPRDNPKKQLQIIFGLSDPGKDTPFAQLDALYHHILSSVKDISRVLEILAFLFLGTTYDGYLSVDFVETLLGYDSGDVAVALTDMHALIRVPPPDSFEFRIYHASLYDFLMDKSRSESFFLDARVRRADIGRHHLRYITTAPTSEYKERRFSIIMDAFINHFLKFSRKEDLAAALKNFSFTTFLLNIPRALFYFVDWEVFFDHLRIECNEPDNDLYRRLRGEFDTWIHNRYERYPESIRHLISAAHAIPTHADRVASIVYLPDIFKILMHSLPPRDADRIIELDMVLFRFQKAPYQFRVDHQRRTPLQNFFIDPSRSGVHSADKDKSGKLAEAIVTGLCRRNEEWPSPPNIRYTKLEYFRDILDAAPEDLKLAQLLWELAVPYNDDDDYVGHDERKKLMANASLDYIKRCGVSIPEHVHTGKCTICANYQPIFTTTSLDANEEIRIDMISILDELDEVQTGNPINKLLSPSVATRSSSTSSTPSANTSPSFHRPSSRSPLAASRTRPTYSLPSSSANYILPDSSSASGSMSNPLLQKGNYERSMGRNTAASIRILPRQPLKKSAPEKPAWK